MYEELHSYKRVLSPEHNTAKAQAPCPNPMMHEDEHRFAAPRQPATGLPLPPAASPSAP